VIWRWLTPQHLAAMPYQEWLERRQVADLWLNGNLRTAT
jgi:hypothetical protein